MPTALERLVWGYGDGSTLPVLPTALGRLGAVICWENYMPLLRAAMYAKGIEVYCAPTADGRETWLPTMRHIAHGRPLLRALGQSVLPAPRLSGRLPDEARRRSRRRCIPPAAVASSTRWAQVLAGPDFAGETILTAEIDLRAIARAKLDFDAVGHYARPDVLRLVVDTTPKLPVEYLRDTSGN